jgi:hypothetical protein
MLKLIKICQCCKFQHGFIFMFLFYPWCSVVRVLVLPLVFCRSCSCFTRGVLSFVIFYLTLIFCRLCLCLIVISRQSYICYLFRGSFGVLSFIFLFNSCIFNLLFIILFNHYVKSCMFLINLKLHSFMFLLTLGVLSLKSLFVVHVLHYCGILYFMFLYIYSTCSLIKYCAAQVNSVHHKLNDMPRLHTYFLLIMKCVI